MTANSSLDAGRNSMTRVARCIGILIVAHAIWGIARIPGKVVMRRVDDVMSYRQDGPARFLFRKNGLAGAEVIAWLRQNTPEQSVVLFDGPRLGAMEFPPALLAPRLFVSTQHCDPASETFVGRPVARGEIDGRTGAVVVHSARDSLRVEVH
jgi:hypothetical protein